MLNRLLNTRQLSTNRIIHKYIKNILELNPIEYEKEKIFKLMQKTNNNDYNLVPNIIDKKIKSESINYFNPINVNTINNNIDKLDLIEIFEFAPYVNNIIISSEMFRNYDKIGEIIPLIKSMNIVCYLDGRELDSYEDIYYMKEFQIDACLIDVGKLLNYNGYYKILCINDKI